jgi:3D (Asp-Asp-Asp) domain-containing protein
MKRLFTFIGVSLGLLQIATAAREQPVLARVTAYWRAEGCGLRASWNGARLRDGHCAVDPKKIPFGSQVVFDDVACIAVDTGPDVVSRKAARACGRNAAERSAIVIDRFFETKEKAIAWTSRHPQFVKVWIVPPGSPSRTGRNRVALDLNLGKDAADQFSLAKRDKRS